MRAHTLMILVLPEPKPQDSIFPRPSLPVRFVVSKPQRSLSIPVSVR